MLSHLSKIFSLWAGLLICPILAFSQRFIPISIPVFTVDSVKMEYGFCGGMNAPQFSTVDLNGDGIEDLFIFDRVGSSVYCFIRKTQDSTTQWEWAPQYEVCFPELFDWVALRDYDQDGVMDIFASSSTSQGPPGVEVYHGRRSEGKLSFERLSFEYGTFDILHYEYAPGKYVNIQVDAPDYPAIEDFDGDGDMDLLTFEPLGGYVYYYRNTDVEDGNPLGTFHFVLEEQCWGKFWESGFSSEIFLSPDSTRCYQESWQVEPRHAGSTLSAWDADSDGDLDLWVGDLTSSHIVFLRNDGRAGAHAWMRYQDPNFPAYATPVMMDIFLASFGIDVSGDGLRDMLVAPNAKYNASNTYNVWYYRNVGRDTSPHFVLESKAFLVGEMLDLGSGAHPAFVDYNADDLIDIVVGNDFYYQPSGVKRSALMLLRNVGTASQPAFRIEDSDWLGFSRFSEGLDGTWSFAPAFGDLDGDGDVDLLVGEVNGGLFYVENTAGPSQPFAYDTIIRDYFHLRALRNAVPAIVDLDRDGLADIVLGSRQATNDQQGFACGNFFYYHNNGTVGNPQFDPDPHAGSNTPCLGRLILQNIRRFGSKVYSAPSFYSTASNSSILLLFAGTNSGIFVIQAGTNPLDSFPIMAANYGALNEWDRLHPAVIDIDSDGILEMLVGNARGGLRWYKTTLRVDGSWTNTTEPKQERVSIEMYYSPRSTLHIKSPSPLTLFLRDLQGKLHSVKRLKEGSTSLYLPSLPTGIYIATACTKEGACTTQRIWVVH